MKPEDNQGRLGLRVTVMLARERVYTGTWVSLSLAFVGSARRDEYDPGFRLPAVRRARTLPRRILPRRTRRTLPPERPVY